MNTISSVPGRLGWRQKLNKTFVKELVNDLLYTPGVSPCRKWWAYQRGFFAERIDLYGLNDDNYQDYLPDFLFYQLQPINGEFGKWIDDKLTMRYVLAPFSEVLPRYYYHLQRFRYGQRVFQLMDCPAGYGTQVSDIIRLLETEGDLAAKLATGSRGQGFYHLAFLDDKYWVNGQSMLRQEFSDFLAGLNGYLVTEFLVPHRLLASITGNRTCSLRLVLLAHGGQAGIAGAYMKMGTEKSAYVDNIHAGGMAVAVELDNGAFTQGLVDLGGSYKATPIHPDSSMALVGTVPFWADIRTTVVAIAEYLPQLKIMGFDIMISDAGFKIIEINSRPALDTMNFIDPTRTREVFTEFLRQHLEESD